MGCLLKLEKIVAGYRDITVIRNLDLEIQDGEKVLLIGPNGAGKSTVFKVIGGLIFPDHGRIYLDDHDITRWTTERRVRGGLGYLLQTNNIVPSLTVEENLELGGYFLQRSELNKRIEEIVEVIPVMKSLFKKRAGLLSGGERQLLAISMVLIRRPKLLLLDEPTAGLAPKAAKELIDYLLQLQSLFGVNTVCMVEHNIKDALRWADRVLIMANGTIVYNSNDVKKLLSNPEILEKYFFQQQWREVS